MKPYVPNETLVKRRQQDFAKLLKEAERKIQEREAQERIEAATPQIIPLTVGQR